MLVCLKEWVIVCRLICYGIFCVFVAAAGATATTAAAVVVGLIGLNYTVPTAIR